MIGPDESLIVSAILGVATTGILYLFRLVVDDRERTCAALQAACELYRDDAHRLAEIHRGTVAPATTPAYTEAVSGKNWGEGTGWAATCKAHGGQRPPDLEWGSRWVSPIIVSDARPEATGAGYVASRRLR